MTLYFKKNLSMQTAIKHYPLTTNQSEMFQEWEEDTKMTQFNICGYYLIEGHPLIAKRMRDVLKPFDPFGEPLVRAEFIETPSRQYLCFEFFHLLADGLTYQSLVNRWPSSPFHREAPPPCTCLRLFGFQHAHRGLQQG